MLYLILLIMITIHFQITYKHKLRSKKLLIRKENRIQNHFESKKSQTNSAKIESVDDLGIARLFDASQNVPIIVPSFRTFNKIIPNNKSTQKQKADKFLQYSVYGCLILIYIKLNLLLIALIGAASYPPGLFFLLICMGLIATLAFKVCYFIVM